MDVDRSDPDGAESGPRATSKACDVCYARKVKCDRKLPCSTCVASHVTCQTTSARPPEKRRRVASASYENEVRRVSDRLASLEKTIHTLVGSSKSTVDTDNPSPRNNNYIVRSSRDLEDDHDSPFEGASSFTAHSKQVSQAFRSVTTPSSTAGLPSESPSTLGLDGDHSNDDTNAPGEDLFELPSTSLVLKVLRAAKTNPKRYFGRFLDLSITTLTDMCQKLFFPTEDFSTAFVTVVNAALWDMFNNFDERDLDRHRIDTVEFERARAVCRRNLNNVARSTPLLLDHSYRQIQALLLLAKQKMVIFWVVFSIDRGLSLNFGRSPSLQDYDITASRPTLAESQGDRDLFFCSIAVDLAYLQGDVYRHLYSSRAQTESTVIKAQHARDMATRLICLRQQLVSFETSSDPLTINMIGGYDLLLQSHLALIYQSIPSTRGDSPLHFSDECVAASRTALQNYNTAWGKYGSRDDPAWKTVINWTYLFSPFTSFIVLFGTVVTLKDEGDLKLMKDSVKTLKSAAQYSSGILKLHAACEVYFNIANSYMTEVVGEPCSGDFSQQSESEPFDMAWLSGQDWNEMLDEWELGLGGENAREMSAFLAEGSFAGPQVS